MDTTEQCTDVAVPLGYCVVLKEPTSEGDKILLDLMKGRFLNLKNTRDFNRATERDYQFRAKSAVNKIRNERNDKTAYRREYRARPDVKEREKMRTQSPQYKANRARERQKKKKLMSKIPDEAYEKALLEIQQEAEINY